MTLPNRQLFWIGTRRGARAGSHLIRASAARSAAGRPGKRTSGSAPAATSGTPLTREASALPAFISGLRLSAFLAADGRRIRIGMNETTGEVVVLESFGL
jgi:hypothetical protein